MITFISKILNSLSLVQKIIFISDGLFYPKNKNQHSDSLDQILVVFFQCKRKGAHFIQGAIRGPLTEQGDALRMTYGVQFIVNCSGLGSIELAGDQGMFPAKGNGFSSP